MRHSSFYFLTFGVLFAPLAIGTVHTWSVAILVSVLFFALVCEIIYRRQRDAPYRRVKVTGWSLAFLLLGAWSCIQLIALPQSIVTLLSPEAWSLYDQGWKAFTQNNASGARPISLDPGQTADRALRWFALALACLVASNTLHRGDHRTWMNRALVGSGLLVVLVGGIHKIRGQKAFLGLFETTVPIRGLSTFVNMNHAAAFYGICALMCMGSLLVEVRARKKTGKWLVVWSSSTIAFMLLSLFHESRSVTIFLVFCLGLLSIGFAERTTKGALLIERLGKIPRKVWLLMSGALIGGGLFVAYGFGAMRVFLSWADTDGLSRWMVVRATFLRSLQFWRTGAGAGSVEQVIYPKMDFSKIPSATIRVAENEAVEWLLTMGWPVTILAMFGLMLAFRRCFPLVRSRGKLHLSRLTLLTMFVFTTMVFLFHFPFIALGVGLPIIVSMEVMFAGVFNSLKSSQKEDKKRIRGFDVSWPVATLGTIALAALIAGCFVAQHKVYDAVELPMAFSEEDDFSKTQIKRTIYERPSEGRSYAYLASKALHQKRPEDAVRFARRAYALEPMAHVNLLLARSYQQNKATEKAQAHFTMLFDGTFKSDDKRWLLIFLNEVRQPEARAFVLQHAPAKTWVRATSLIQRVQGVPLAQDFLLELVALKPQSSSAYKLLIDGYLELKLYSLVKTWAQLLRTRKVGSPRENAILFHAYLFQSYVGQGDMNNARATLDEGLKQFPNERTFLLLMLQLRPSQPSIEEIKATSDSIERACKIIKNSKESFQCLDAQAWLYIQTGEHKKAEEALQQIVYSHMNPNPLIAYYTQRSQCLKLRSFGLKWGSSRSKNSKLSNAEKHVATRLTNASKRCTRKK